MNKLVFISGMLLMMGIGRAQPQPPPNILLIVADDQRPDTIHALGNTYIDTPNLDRLVAAGSSFHPGDRAQPPLHAQPR